MKVLFLTSTLPRFKGDSQAPFVLEQAQAWRARRPNDQVIILAPHHYGTASRETVGEVEIRRFRYFFPERLQALAYPAILPNLKRNPLLAIQLLPYLICAYFAAKRLIRDNNIDLVYAHWVMPQGVVAYWLKRAIGVPYVLQNHSSDLAVFHKTGGLGGALARLIVRRAHWFFCVNRQQKDEMLEFFPEPERSEIANRVAVLPMGVGMDVDAVHPAKAGRSLSRYTVSTLSRLSRKKGLDLLIAAAEQLAQDGVIVPMAIAGDGEDRDALMAMPKRADISFPGFVSGAGKVDFFNETRFLAFPSVASGSDVEGLPVALLEALCCGKIVIATPDSNVKMLDEWEQVASDVVLLENPKDIKAFAEAIKALVARDPASFAARSTHLRSVMARYRWERLIEEYLEIIEAITKSDSSSETEAPLRKMT